MFYGETSVRRNIRTAKFPTAKFPTAKFPSAKFPSGNYFEIHTCLGKESFVCALKTSCLYVHEKRQEKITANR